MTRYIDDWNEPEVFTSAQLIAADAELLDDDEDIEGLLDDDDITIIGQAVDAYMIGKE